MKSRLQTWWPEIGIGILALFFFCRELGTFPAAWLDDSLYMIAAKSIVAGNGISIPVLDQIWHFPSVLHVGPPLLYPVAWAIQAFGFSVAVARLPMVIYLIATSVCIYVFTYRIAGRREAQLATLLLITLSAFVNTGKPVMGEVPAFFFLMLAINVLLRKRLSAQWTIAAGAFLSLAILSKETYMLIIPVLALVWIRATSLKNWEEALHITIMGTLVLAFFLPLKFLEMESSTGQLLGEYVRRLSSRDEVISSFLDSNPMLLLRIPFVYFGAMLILGSAGLLEARKKITGYLWVIIALLIGMFIFYFLSGPGWYRHLLMAHLLLIPFIPTGSKVLLRQPIAYGFLALLIIVQGLWQLDHRGSSSSTQGTEAAQILKEKFADEQIIIRQAEVFVQLPENPNWLFLSHEPLAARFPTRLTTLTPAQACMRQLFKVSEEQKNLQVERLEEITPNYVLIAPSTPCN